MRWSVAYVVVLAFGCGEDSGGDGAGGGAAAGGKSSGGAGGSGAATGGAAGSSGAVGSGGASASGGAGGASGSAGSAGAAGSAGSAGTGGSGCVSLPTFADGKTPARTIHVSGSASGGGDGSEQNPFQSLTEAQASATPGTEIRVSGEIVSTAFVKLVGTADAPIWITGEAGAKLRGGSVPALRLDASSYLIVQDLELYESPDHVLHFDFSDHLLLRRLHVHRATTACLKGSQSTDLYVEDSDFHGAAELSGGNPQSTQVFDLVGVNRGHIVRSKFHDGPNVMIMLKGGTSDLFFAWNEIYDQTSDQSGAALHLGQSTGPQFFQPQDADYEALRLVAFANLIHDVAGPPFAFQGCKDCAGVHNTIYATTGGQLVRYLPGAAGAASGQTQSLTSGSRFTGNIVVGGQAGGASLNADPGSLGTNNQLDHNVFFKPGSLNWWSPLAQETTTSSYDQDPQLSAGGLPANVALVDGKGASDLAALPFATLFVRDHAGACVSAPLDIGALAVGAP